MTIISTVLGGLPLILSGGPGGEARAAIGWVVFGGLGLAALFTLYLTPVVYLALARFAKPRAAEGARLERELREAASVPRRVSALLEGDGYEIGVGASPSRSAPWHAPCMAPAGFVRSGGRGGPAARGWNRLEPPAR